MLLNIKRHIDQRSAEFNMISLLFNNNTAISTETIVFFYKCRLCISCHFGPLKPLTIRMDHAKKT